MKLSSVILVFFVLIGIPSRGQEYLIESKSATIVYEVPDLTKDQIYKEINSWFGEQDSTSEFEFVQSDAASGTISIKEENQVFYKNLGRIMYPKRSGMAELLSANFFYNIDIAIEEGAYMVIYKLTGMSEEVYGRDDLFFDCIDFEEIDQEALDAYNKSMNKYLKMNGMFKKRRGIFLDNTKSQFEDVSQNILSGMTGNMGSLYGHLSMQ